MFQSPLKGATIPYRPPQSHQQHQIDDSCPLQQQQQQHHQHQQQQQQQHFISKGSPPPPTQTSSSLSPTPPPSSTTSCSRTESPVMTSFTHPMVVMTSPYLNGGGSGGGGLTTIAGEASPMCNGMPGTGYFSPPAPSNLNNNNNHIPAAAASSLYQPPPAMQAAPQMSAQSSHLSQPHLVKPFLNSSTTGPLASQYIYFPSAVPMSDPFAYSTLMSMGAGQPASMSAVTQSNLLSAAAAQPPIQPQFYPAAPFSGLEHYMNYKNGHLGPSMTSPSSPPFLSSPVQIHPERPMMFSSQVPDVSLARFRGNQK